MLNVRIGRRLVHWRGFPISLPLAPDDADHLEHPIQATTADNSIACISLEPVSLGSDSVTGEGGGVNDLYACIDAKTWQPERKTAHLLDGPSEVIAFALDRTETKNLSSTANGTSQSKKVFGVEPILWVDRYMLDRRKTIVGLREEVGKAEEEMDAALRQKEALANSGVSSRTCISTRADADALARLSSGQRHGGNLQGDLRLPRDLSAS